MYRVIKISTTMFIRNGMPLAGCKIEYLFENENGNRVIRILYTTSDKCTGVVNKIVGQPFVRRFIDIGLPPVLQTSEHYTRVTYRLKYTQRG